MEIISAVAGEFVGVMIGEMRNGGRREREQDNG
jgi:hypothetical protein